MERFFWHIAGDTKGILSGVMFKFGSSVLENYEKLVDRIYAMIIEPFYSSTNDKDLDHLTEDQKSSMEQVISSDKPKKRLVDFESVEQRYMLWKKLTQERILPLFQCQQIIPIMCSYWNVIKYVGDQITQMIWEIKFRLPKLTPKLVAATKITFFCLSFKCTGCFRSLQQTIIFGTSH